MVGILEVWHREPVPSVRTKPLRVSDIRSDGESRRKRERWRIANVPWYRMAGLVGAMVRLQENHTGGAVELRRLSCFTIT